jgi:hypothetical protein
MKSQGIIFTKYAKNDTLAQSVFRAFRKTWEEGDLFAQVLAGANGFNCNDGKQRGGEMLWAREAAPRARRFRQP